MSADDEIRTRVGAALDQAFRDGDGDMVTRWVVLVEVIGQSGERAVWTLAPTEAMAWDVLGLLTYAVQMEQAKAVTDALGER